MKRLFDITLSLVLLLILLPVMILITLVVMLDFNGGPFYFQKRIGRYGRPFTIYKFRTMKPGSDREKRITVGERDPRITLAGRWLRRSKVDELPQLFNVLTGDMSLVGPRPEVEEYVAMYSDEQRKVLSVRPGITDLASIAYADESKVLDGYEYPEKAYVEQVMPDKLKLNLQYIEQQSFGTDLHILWRTFIRLMFRGQGRP